MTTRGESSKQERTFFIVNRQKLMKETDELKDAIVVYRPQSDLKKSNLEHRCSQLVGLSLLSMNLTGSVPKYIRLKQSCFAVRQLSEDYIMCLANKYDEPPSYAKHFLDQIHDSFIFYYQSPENVMEMSCDQWDIFLSQMGGIFNCIFNFVFEEIHSLPSMFSPLPYVLLDQQKGGSRLFLQAQRLLRLCQVHESIIGGCLFYNGEIICSQLPSSMEKKLLLVANGGVELNSRSVLEADIAPESVWLINVYLTQDENIITQHTRRDFGKAYSFLRPKNISSAMLLPSKAHQPPAPRSLEKSSSRKNQALNRTHSNTSEEFTILQSNIESVSYSKRSEVCVSPLKKASLRGRNRSIADELGSSLDFFEWSQTSIPSGENHAPTPPVLPPRARQQQKRDRLGAFSTVLVKNANPPLPPKGGASLPPKPLEGDVPPLPPKPQGNAPPPPPPPHQRTTKTKPQSSNYPSSLRPVPPPRDQSTLGSDLPPPPPPPHRSAKKLPQTGDAETPKKFQSPPPPPPPPRAGQCDSPNSLAHDSDGSEGYATPSSPGPMETRPPVEYSHQASVESLSHNKFSTPIHMEHENGLETTSETAAIEQPSDKEHLEQQSNSVSSSPVLEKQLSNMSVNSDPQTNGQEIPHVRHVAGDGDTPSSPFQSPQNEGSVSGSLKRGERSSTVSSDSLVILQALSESPGSYYQADTAMDANHSEADNQENEEEEEEDENGEKIEPEESTDGHVEVDDNEEDHFQDVQDEMDDEVEDSHNDFEDTRSYNTSPSEQEGSEPVTEEQLKAMKMVTLAAQTMRPANDQWTPLSEETQHVPKCLYIQKCVNTMVAIVADIDLPKDHVVIESLWKLLLAQLLELNNTVQGAVVDREDLYVPADAVKADGVRPNITIYQAMYSNTTATTNVSSESAPYQFRHAVRRVHHEYAQQPALRQISLIKEHCKMISQNVMGRETYFHCTRCPNLDTMAIHSHLERKARSQKQLPPSPGFKVNFL